MPIQLPKESQKTPLKDTPTGRPSKVGISGEGSGQPPNKRSSDKAPLMKLARQDFKAREEKIQTGGTPGSKRSSSGRKLDSAAIDKTWAGFEQEDATHEPARRVLQMNPQTGITPLSLADHEDMSMEILMERDAPNREGTSSGAVHKRKEESTTYEELVFRNRTR